MRIVEIRHRLRVSVDLNPHAVQLLEWGNVVLDIAFGFACQLHLLDAAHPTLHDAH
jgi:hypothetical protein